MPHRRRSGNLGGDDNFGPRPPADDAFVCTASVVCLRAPIRDGFDDGTSSGEGEEVGDSTGVTTVDPDEVCHPSYVPCLPTLLETQLRDAAPSRLSWMTLLARVFRIDITVCARRSGPMKVTRFVTRPEESAAELHGARPPPRGPGSGQLVVFSAVP